MKPYGCLAFRRLILSEFGAHLGEYLFRCLADRLEPRGHSVNLLLKGGAVNIGTDCADLLGIVLALRGSPPNDHMHFADTAASRQPVGNVHHDIADADHRHPLAHFKRTRAESGKQIIMIDAVFGMIDALGRIAFDPDGFGTLRSCRKDEDARLKRLELWDGQMLAFPDGHVAEVMDIGAAEDFPVPLSEPSAQLVLIGKDAVFREPAELHVPIQDHDFMTTLGHDVGDGHTGRTRPHHHH